MEIKEIRLGGLVIPRNVFMAPLAGYTCYPFRMLCQELGAGICYTEMVSANSLRYMDQATQKLLFTTPEERIKAIQLLGCEPSIMERMAESDLLSGFDLIDINMGCPVPNIFKSGQGSALMGDLKGAAAVIRACGRSGKPVTVKCRAGIRVNDLFAAEFARMCEDAGAQLLTIHGRSRSMMYDGKPYWEQVRQAKASVQIPVIANGGIFSAQEAETAMKETGADGVMIARYALENPFIFSELTGREIRKDKYRILMDQIALTSRYYDETFTLTYIKRLASYCMKKRKGTKQYKAKLYQCGNRSELEVIIKKIFCEEDS